MEIKENEVFWLKIGIGVLCFATIWATKSGWPLLVIFGYFVYQNYGDFSNDVKSGLERAKQSLEVPNTPLPQSPISPQNGAEFADFDVDFAEFDEQISDFAPNSDFQVVQNLCRDIQGFIDLDPDMSQSEIAGKFDCKPELVKGLAGLLMGQPVPKLKEGIR